MGSGAKGFEVDGRRLVSQLRRLPDRVANRAARKAVNAGIAVIVTAVKPAAPVGETGNLKKSVGKKTKQYNRADRTVGLVGPRIDSGRLGFHGHLVEDGHINSDGSFTPGHPWLRPAATRAMPAAEKRMVEKLGQEIEKEAKQA